MSPEGSKPRSKRTSGTSPKPSPPPSFYEERFVDDVGMLLDRKAHVEVDRLVTCGCDGCLLRARKQVTTSYMQTFPSYLPREELPSVITDLYAKYQRRVRRAKEEIPPVNDEITIFLKD